MCEPIQPAVSACFGHVGTRQMAKMNFYILPISKKMLKTHLKRTIPRPWFDLYLRINLIYMNNSRNIQSPQFSEKMKYRAYPHSSSEN